VVETRAATLRQLQGLLRAGEAGLVVNLTGPLGVGKTTLLDELGAAAEGVDLPAVDGADGRAVVLADGASTAIIIDGVDSEAAARSLLAAVGRAGQVGGSPVVVTSRLPLLSRAGWARCVRSLVTLTVPRWPDDEIEQLAARYRPSDRATLELVVALSGGIPLIADCLCRTVAGGTPADWPGAVAGPAADEILRRLEHEHLTSQNASALLALAAVGEADEELLDGLTAGRAEHSPFPALSQLSITTRSAHGLTIKEPYRELLDLAHRWRRPLAHQGLLTKAAVNRRRLLAATAADTPAVAGAATQLMFLTGNRTVRDTLFPPSAQAPTIRAAQPGDEEDIGRLMHRWARRGSLSAAKCETMLETWLGSTPNGFHLAVDGDGRPLAMVNMLPVSDQTHEVTQMLLQQHAETLARPTPRGMDGGLLIGMAISEDGQPAAHAALLRHFLVQGIQHGRVLVSTPWPAYQQLARSLGLVHHGATRDDLYRCGRRNEIYGQDFAPEHLPGWVDRLFPPAGRLTASDPQEQRVAAQVRQALRDLHRPARLAANPLLAWLELSAAEDLRTTLLLTIQGLCSSDIPAEAEAGHVLAGYYLSRRGGHEHVANKLHLSRSTYFRRLNHGIGLITARLPRPILGA
jgi:hypothetical protein